MSREEIIKQFKNAKYEIADVRCDIEEYGRIFKDESVLVFLVSSPCNDDLVIPCNHWWICSSVEEFLTKFGVAKEIREFKSDFK